MSDKYGYIGIERLLNFCENTKDHSVTPNDFMRMPRIRPDDFPGQWISVTELLPKENGEYWVTIDDNEINDGEREPFVLSAWFNTDKSGWFGEYGWSLLNEFYDLTPRLRKNITAWMKLPKPYRGDDHDEG